MTKAERSRLRQLGELLRVASNHFTADDPDEWGAGMDALTSARVGLLRLHGTEADVERAGQLMRDKHARRIVERGRHEPDSAEAL